MKHGCKMNTVVSKSFNDRLKIATVSALMAGTFLCLPFTVYAENPLISDVEQTVRNISVKGVVVDANGEPVIGASVQLKGSTGIERLLIWMVSSLCQFRLTECCKYPISDIKRLK